MKLLLSRSATLFSTALLLLISSTCLPVFGFQMAQAQDEAKQIAELETVLRTTADKHQAIKQLADITSEKASELLLKTLKNNLENRRGFYTAYGTVSFPGGVWWTSVSSENHLLVEALGRRKYEKALPTLRKMFTIKEKWRGTSKDVVAANIYLITSQPVKYYVDGEVKIYPEPPLKTDGSVLFSSLQSTSSGEAAWKEDSLNARVRELVRLLADPGGPAGWQEPHYRTLKEEIGLSTLMGLVKNGDPLVRPYALQALAILGENLDQVIPVLVAAAGEKDPRVRFRSVRGLGRLLGSNFKPEEEAMIVSALKTTLSDAEAEIRYTAVLQFYLQGIGNHTSSTERQEIERLLVSALDDRVDDVRRQAASTLGRLGTFTSELVARLINMMKSPLAGDRESAAEALIKIYDHSLQSEEAKRFEKDIWRALFIAANDPATDVRYRIAGGLGELGPVVPGVIPALIKMTRDPSKGVRYEAAGSLGRFKMDRARIVPALVRMLNVEDEDEDAEVVQAALFSLQEIGPEARSAVPEVRKLLKSKNPRLRERAGNALEKIDVPLSQAEKR